MYVKWAVAFAALFALMAGPGEAFAYVGPGAGLSAMGVIVAVGAAIILAIFGFVWYPVKRALRKSSAKAQRNPEVEEKQRSEPGGGE